MKRLMRRIYNVIKMNKRKLWESLFFISTVISIVFAFLFVAIYQFLYFFILFVFVVIWTIADKCNKLLNEITEKQFIGDSTESIENDIDKYSEIVSQN